MFVVLQFPFADVRRFVADTTYPLKQPEWGTSLVPGKHFVRSFGSITRRPRGAKNNFRSAHISACARGTLQFPEFNNESDFVPAFQNLACDGIGKATFEIGFRSKLKPSSTDFRLLLKAPVKLKSRIGESAATALIRVGKPLSSRIIDATTDRARTNSVQKNKRDQFKPEDWWMKPCRPLLVIDYEMSGELKASKYFVPVSNPILAAHGISLAHAWIKCENTEIRTWLLGRSTKTDFDLLQRLRSNLCSIHSDIEVLNEILRLHLRECLPLEADTKNSQLLLQYIGRIASVLRRKTRDGVTQSDILTVACDIDRWVTEDDREQLLSTLDRVEGMRPNSQRNIRAVVSQQQSERQPCIIAGTVLIKEVNVTNQSANISGDNNVLNQVAHSTVTDSLNNVRSSPSANEVKPKLEELHVEVEKILPKLPQDTQTEVANDLQAFTNEALKKKPRKEWYELSSKGLVEAAKSVGEVADPIVKVVKTILELIAIAQ